MIHCIAVMGDVEVWIDPEYVIAVSLHFDEFGKETTKLGIPSGGAIEVYDEGRVISRKVVAWKENL